MKLTAEQVGKIREIINLGEYAHYGIRTEETANCGTRNVGDVLEPSHDWIDPADAATNMGVDVDELDPDCIVDGVYDGGELRGSCATEVTLDDLAGAVDCHAQYCGDRCYLIASDDREWGYDEREIILEDAVVVAVL